MNVDLIIVMLRALEVAKSKGHKTLGPADMLKALEMMEFTDQVSRTEDDLDGMYPHGIVNSPAYLVAAYRDGAKRPRLRETATVKKRGGSSKDGGAYKGKIKTPIASHISPSRPRAQPIIENSDDEGEDDPDDGMHDEDHPQGQRGSHAGEAGWATDDTGDPGLDDDEDDQRAADEGLLSDVPDDDDQLVD